MATSADYEKLMECRICMGMYTDPKSLDCRHVFCCKCLVNVYLSHPVGGRSRNSGLQCPLCRQITPLPDTVDGAEDKIRRLPSDFNMLSLTDLSAKNRNGAGKRRELLQSVGDKLVQETDSLKALLEKNKVKRQTIVENKTKIVNNINLYYERLQQELSATKKKVLADTEHDIDEQLSAVDNQIELQEKHVSDRERRCESVLNLSQKASDLELSMLAMEPFQSEANFDPDESFKRPIPTIKHKLNLNASIERVQHLKPYPVRFVNNGLSPFVEDVSEITPCFYDDKFAPHIKSLILTGDNDDCLLLSDTANTKMKALHGINETTPKRYQLSLTYVPHDMTNLTEHHIAGVSPEHKNIMFFVTDEEICLQKKVSTRASYTCLTKLDNELMALSWRPPSFDVLSTEGKLLRTVSLQPFSPVSVCVTTSGHLAVSDQEFRSVIIMDSNGQCLNRKAFPEEWALSSVSGVCCDEHSNIFVLIPDQRSVVVMEERADSDALVDLTKDIQISQSHTSLILDSNDNLLLADTNIIKVFKLAYG